jgi:hypothetical protein
VSKCLNTLQNIHFYQIGIKPTKFHKKTPEEFKSSGVFLFHFVLPKLRLRMDNDNQLVEQTSL